MSHRLTRRSTGRRGPSSVRRARTESKGVGCICQEEHVGGAGELKPR